MPRVTVNAWSMARRVTQVARRCFTMVLPSFSRFSLARFRLRFTLCSRFGRAAEHSGLLLVPIFLVLARNPLPRFPQVDAQVFHYLIGLSESVISRQIEIAPCKNSFACFGPQTGKNRQEPAKNGKNVPN